jgi:CubicO group peptidase (beta-lactamase class C family)
MGLILVFVTLLVGLPAAAASDFSPVRRLLDTAVAEGAVAGGSVLVLHRGEVVFEEGFGFAHLKSKTPFRVDTPAVIASISKPLLGTAAFRLAENGKLKLSNPIADYLDEFASPACQP